MKLVYAEKPDMGRKIADAIGATERHGGWREGNGWLVTWGYGHMVEIYAPEAEGPWKAEALPVIPKQFHLRPIPSKDGSYEKQIEVVRRCMARCDSLVEATDAGREGELIFRNLMEYLGNRKPFQRAWLQALEPESIAAAFLNLRPGSEFDGLAAAAKQREIADWLVGINATRALTLAVGKRREPLSLGRVQTPTLKLICDRYIENRTFKSVPYWFLRGETVKDGIRFRWESTERYDRREPAERDLAAVLDDGILTVEAMITQRKTENPPLLHDLASLQKEANARYRMAMEDTQAVLEGLYLRQLVTYPRTVSRYIPEVLFEKMPSILQRHAGDPIYGQFAAALAQKELNRRSVDDEKVGEHHALVVTGRVPRDLQEAEQRIYNLILCRIIEAFSPVCVADVTRVDLTCVGIRFQARSRKVVSMGWRSVSQEGDYQDVDLSDVDLVEMNGQPLPGMQQGDRIPVSMLEMVEDETRPKPLFSDATLLTAMQNAGSASDDKEIADALRDLGIGTSATRAEIKKTLLARGYVQVKNNRFVPKKLGLHVYNAVRAKSISDVALTARWEKALAQVAEGQRDAASFETAIRKYTVRITDDIFSNSGDFDRLKQFVAEESLLCPACGSELKMGQKSLFCTNRQCKFVLWREKAGKALSDNSLVALVRNGQTPLISGFTDRKGQKFDAYLKLNPDWTVGFEFPAKKN